MVWSRYTIQKQVNYLVIGDYLIKKINDSKNFLSYLLWYTIYYMSTVNFYIVGKIIFVGDKIFYGRNFGRGKNV